MLKCVICGIEMEQRMSCDPYPVKNEGRCCKICDRTHVTPARMALAGKIMKPEEIQKLVKLEQELMEKMHQDSRR